MRTKLTNKKYPEGTTGIIGRYYENEFPVIIKLLNKLPKRKWIDTLPYLTVISWRYDGSQNNGLPIKEINTRMLVLEEALHDMMSNTTIFIHAYSRTGNSLKEFVYYSSSQEEFMDIINTVLKGHDRYPIEIKFYEDSKWKDLKRELSYINYKSIS